MASRKNKSSTVAANPGSAALLLGESLPQSPTLGFKSRAGGVAQNDLIVDAGDAHLNTFGKTGSRKSRGAAIPNLLEYRGSAVVLDVKGELFHTTARRRRETGRRVVLLGSFHLISDKPDRLNPFDIYRAFDQDTDCPPQLFVDRSEPVAVAPQLEIVINGLSSRIL